MWSHCPAAHFRKVDRLWRDNMAIPTSDLFTTHSQ